MRMRRAEEFVTAAQAEAAYLLNLRRAACCQHAHDAQGTQETHRNTTRPDHCLSAISHSPHSPRVNACPHQNLEDRYARAVAERSSRSTPYAASEVNEILGEAHPRPWVQTGLPNADVCAQDLAYMRTRYEWGKVQIKDVPLVSLSTSLSSCTSSARPFPFRSFPVLRPEAFDTSSGNETLRALDANREGPASDGEGGTSSTPPIPPENGIRSRVRKPRSMPMRGPRSIGLCSGCAGFPRCLSLVNCEGGDGEGVSGVGFSTNSAIRVSTQSRAFAPHAQVVNVDASVWSMEVIWLRKCWT